MNINPESALPGITRRDFIKAASAASLAAVVSGPA
ncbi:twin-arginine translocation signal domain-containing protein, partial [bacterium]